MHQGTYKTKIKPQRTLYWAWSTAILPSQGTSLRKIELEEGERNHEMPGLSAAQTDSIRGHSGPTPTTHGKEGRREFRGVEAVLSIPSRRRGKVCCSRPKSILISHINHWDTHTVSLAQLQALSNRTHGATKT